MDPLVVEIEQGVEQSTAHDRPDLAPLPAGHAQFNLAPALATDGAGRTANACRWHRASQDIIDTLHTITGRSVVGSTHPLSYVTNTGGAGTGAERPRALVPVMARCSPRSTPA